MSSGTTQVAQGRGAGRPPDLRSRLRTLAPIDAKLRVPTLRPGLVARPALVERVRTGEPVVVVSAPAGYGKTTLLSQWAAAEDRPLAWLTITESDNDLTVLVAYLIRALDEIDAFPTASLAAFANPGADGPTVVLPRLGRMLLERPRPFVLALDDIHLLTDPDCVGALGVLVSHLPEGSQLAFATRHDPPLARARLRARGALMEVRAEDLTLTGAEGTAALRDAGVNLSDEVADLLVQRTEGWAAGLYLAALTVRGLPDANDAASRFTGDHRLVAEYLRDELIDGLSDDVVEFLTHCSVLEYLDGAACDAVLERTGSWEVLEDLARSNLFVVPLDEVGEQYRFHHLFGDLLRTELRRREPALEAELHARASALFGSRAEMGLAVQHARLAGDNARAAALLWIAAPAYLGTGRSTTLERWLAPFGPEDFTAHPELAVVAAWCCISTQTSQPISSWISIARLSPPDRVLADGTPLESAASLLEAVAADQGMLHMAEAAARAHQLDRDASFYRFTALYLEGSALLLLDRVDEAKDRLEEAVRGGVAIVPGAASSALAQLALIAATTASWGEADHLIDRALDLVDEHRLGELVPQVLVFAVAALSRAKRGETVAAHRFAVHARKLLSRFSHFAVWLTIEARVVLGRAELLLGDPEAARVLAVEARDFLTHIPDAGVLPESVEALFAAIEAGKHAKTSLGVAPLTTAELRVLAYLPTHLSFQAMAQDLFVSRNTVKTQAISIYRKLGVSSRGEAVARSRELGLLED